MRTFDTPNPITVNLELGIADVRIDAGPRRDTVLDIQPSDPASETDLAAATDARVEFANGTLLVRSPKRWKHWTPWGPRGSVVVRIEIPTGSAIHGTAGLGALRCTGELGACRYHTGLGDISIEQAGAVDLKAGVGDVTVDTAQGRTAIKTAGAIRVGSIGGPATIKSSNGDTWIGELCDEARTSAANGKIFIDHAHAGVVAKTANGDVRIAGVERGPVVAQTAYGAVDVDISGAGPVWMDVETRFGRVRNDLEETNGPVAGEGSIEVRAQTSMGDINVRRSSGSSVGGPDA
jgi:Toastrack DUF4097